MASNVNLYNQGNDTGEAAAESKAADLLARLQEAVVQTATHPLDSLNYALNSIIPASPGQRPDAEANPLIDVSSNNRNPPAAGGAVAVIPGCMPPVCGPTVVATPGAVGYGSGNATFNSGDNGNTQGPSEGASPRNTSDLQNAANQPTNDSGLSVAARAWDKHAGRPGGTFEPLTGSIRDKNAAASEFVNQVLNDPSATQTSLSRGGVEFRLPNGQGIRFNADGSFSGFLDPRK